MDRSKDEMKPLLPNTWCRFPHQHRDGWNKLNEMDKVRMELICGRENTVSKKNQPGLQIVHYQLHLEWLRCELWTTEVEDKSSKPSLPRSRPETNVNNIDIWPFWMISTLLCIFCSSISLKLSHYPVLWTSLVFVQNQMTT